MMPSEITSNHRPLTAERVPKDLQQVYARRMEIEAKIAECELAMGMPTTSTSINHPKPPGRTPLYEHIDCPVYKVQQSLSLGLAVRQSQLGKNAVPLVHPEMPRETQITSPDHEKHVLELEQMMVTTMALHKKQQLEKHRIQTAPGDSLYVPSPIPNPMQPSMPQQTQPTNRPAMPQQMPAPNLPRQTSIFGAPPVQPTFDQDLSAGLQGHAPQMPQTHQPPQQQPVSEPAERQGHTPGTNSGRHFAQIAQLARECAQRYQYQVDTMSQIMQELQQLRADIHGRDQYVQGIDQKMQHVFPTLKPAMHDSHGQLSGEAQELRTIMGHIDSKAAEAFQSAKKRLQTLEQEMTEINAYLRRHFRGTLQRPQGSQTRDASPGSDTSVRSAQSLPSFRPVRLFSRVSKYLTGQREAPPQDPLTRPFLFADYKAQYPRDEQPPTIHAGPPENAEVPDMNNDADLPDSQSPVMPTTPSQQAPLFTDQTITPPFMPQPTAAPSMTLFGPATEGMYTAHTATTEAAWLKCEVDDEEEQQRVFLSTSRMPNGKLSMIVDSGAFSNMMGEELALCLEKRALDMDLDPTRSDLIRPMTVSGVGNGTNQATEQVNCPIAIQTTSGKVELHSLRAPVMCGTGKHLPGLLGLQTLEANNAVLDIGNRTLHMLSKGKAKLELPPGTLSVPLEKSPSGHLVMTIDSFEDIQRQRGGLPQRSINWHAATASTEKPPTIKEDEPHKLITVVQPSTH